MKTFAIMTLVAASMTFSSLSWACGGGDLSDDEVKTAAPVVLTLKEVSADLGQKIEIEKIVRAGNEMLNLDEQVVARAMCAANFTHVYLKSEQGTRCLTMLDVRPNKRIQQDFNVTFVSCRLANGEQKRYELK